MKHLFLPLLFLPSFFALVACEESNESEKDVEYANWQVRNDLFFAEKMQEARKAIADAKKAHGDNWQDYTNWRMQRTYAKVDDSKPATNDSICYEVVEKGNGTVRPAYTDSVDVNFAARLIPTDKHKEGLMFSYTGLYPDESNIFNPLYAVPTRFSVSNLVEGVTTVLLYMNENDRVRVYIPENLGYGASAVQTVPAYSTLIYEMQLKKILQM